MREYPDNGKMICRDCRHKMAKAGKPLSGRQRVQGWKCSECGWKALTKLEERK